MNAQIQHVIATPLFKFQKLRPVRPLEQQRRCTRTSHECFSAHNWAAEAISQTSAI